MKHTAGPWKWSGISKWGRECLEPCVIYGTVEGLIDVSDEDAFLIEAAPDLLSALKHARNVLGHPDQMIDDAIAKAEGRLL